MKDIKEVKLHKVSCPSESIHGVGRKVCRIVTLKKERNIEQIKYNYQIEDYFHYNLNGHLLFLETVYALKRALDLI